MARKVFIFVIAYILYVPAVFGLLAVGVVWADKYVDTSENPLPGWLMVMLLGIVIAAPAVIYAAVWNRPPQMGAAATAERYTGDRGHNGRVGHGRFGERRVGHLREADTRGPSPGGQAVRGYHRDRELAREHHAPWRRADGEIRPGEFEARRHR